MVSPEHKVRNSPPNTAKFEPHTPRPPAKKQQQQLRVLQSCQNQAVQLDFPSLCTFANLPATLKYHIPVPSNSAPLPESSKFMPRTCPLPGGENPTPTLPAPTAVAAPGNLRFLPADNASPRGFCKRNLNRYSQQHWPYQQCRIGKP